MIALTVPFPIQPRIAWISRLCGLYAVVGGLVALTGWFADLPRLTDWFGHGIAMFANTAICAILSGAALALLTLPDRRQHIGAQIMAGIVLTIALLTLLQHASGVNLGIDTLLINRPWGQAAASAPMRMGLPASTSFTLIGVALLLCPQHQARLRKIASALGVIVVAIAMLSLLGYLYGAHPLFAVPRLTGIAFQTASMLAALGVGLVAAVPERGLAQVLAAPDAGGVLARRALLPVIVAPIFLGGLRVAGQNAGLYETNFGSAIFAISMIACFFGLLVWTARDLSRASRTLAERARLLDLTADAILIRDHDNRILYWNRGAEDLYGYSAQEALGRVTHDLLKTEFSVPLEEIERIVRERSYWQGELTYTGKDGSRRTVLSRWAIDQTELATGARVLESNTDVTPWREAQAALRRSERDLSDFFESANVGLHWVGPDGIILRANQADLDLVGYTEEEYVGHHIAEFHADREVIDDMLARLLRGEELREHPAQLRRKDGSIRDVLINSSALFEDGNFLHTRCFTLDITQRRLAEEGRNRLAAIVDSSDDAIVAKNLDGTITAWNAGAERLFGYTAAEAIGQPISILFPPDRLDEESTIIERLKRGERVEHFETIRLRKDGTPLDISLTISPVKDDSGRIIGASKIARDITERKRIEEALRRNYETFFNLVDQSPFGVYVIDSQFRIHQVNKGAQPAFRNVRPLIGRDFAEALRIIWPEPVATKVLEIFKHTLESGEPYFAPSLTEKRADVDAVESYEWQIHRITLPDGQYAVVCNYFDATKLRKTEQELARASHLKDEFLATLSHELRTPMAAIQGWSHMLRSTTSPEEIKQGIEVIERNARLQSQIIEDLLDMSRIISGKVRLDVQSVQMGEIVDAAVDAIRPAAAARGVHLKSICDIKVSEVRGDPNRLQQVVYNLLTNAVKFTPRDGQVQVACQRVNSHVEVSISDTGMGIKQEFLPHVFERFRQQDASTTRQHQGLGLGLAIVKQIVELHGGRVQAASEGEGKGATFTVHLPVSIAIAPSLPDSWDRVQARVHPITERTTAGEIVPLDNHALKDLKVLVVDDEPDARDLICRMLMRHGAKVFVAASAADALDRLTGHRPNVMVCDIGMPGMDGYSLIREVRSLSPDRGGDTPALALTAFARSEDRTRSLRAGFQMHLSKPVEPQELIASIVNLADRTRK